MMQGKKKREHMRIGGRRKYKKLVKGLVNGSSGENRKRSGGFAPMVGWRARRQGGREGRKGEG